MFYHRAMIAIACLATVGLGSINVMHAAPRAQACAEVRTVCQQAGFVRGGNRTGEGLVADCIRPIMRESAQRPRASKPLPQIDPQVVAECRAQNPNFGLGNAARVPAAAPAPRADVQHPNIVFVLTDDLSLNLIQYMPHVSKMQKDGTTFANYFVTDSLCCPSRSSIFTGRFPHNTGIFRNVGNDGGFTRLPQPRS